METVTSGFTQPVHTTSDLPYLPDHGRRPDRGRSDPREGAAHATETRLEARATIVPSDQFYCELQQAYYKAGIAYRHKEVRSNHDKLERGYYGPILLGLRLVGLGAQLQVSFHFRDTGTPFVVVLAESCGLVL
ncbi:hypothetical protein Bbelb_110860 [Branchiostoma belcheri]|nr:hypothetical protein Bbelb_110860 [Branchiostoma belcheri]